MQVLCGQEHLVTGGAGPGAVQKVRAEETGQDKQTLLLWEDTLGANSLQNPPWEALSSTQNSNGIVLRGDTILQVCRHWAGSARFLRRKGTEVSIIPGSPGSPRTRDPGNTCS